MCARIMALVAAVSLITCQNYPFETRPPRRVQAKKITEVIATLVPADILIVVDNSGTMENEIAELQNNIGLFIEELAKSENEFQVGLITTDVECNMPGRDCGPGTLFSHSCCLLNPGAGCEDRDTNGDTVIDTSDCDGGRLRASNNRRIFTRPAAGEEQQWVNDFRAILGDLGTHGSSYEAGLEAVLRAVRCSVGTGCDPRDGGVADLNAGFIRENADLVIIFVTDEDDCSVMNRNTYQRPIDPGDGFEQESTFCWPDECYAEWGNGLDADSDGLWDWSDPQDDGYFRCGNPRTHDRQVNPPALTAVGNYIDELAALKGGIGRIRAAGIISAVEAPAADLMFEPFGCRGSSTGPSNNCGCLGSSLTTPLWCEVTERAGQSDTLWPTDGTCNPTSNCGCQTMPSGRYAAFFEQLSARRQAMGERSDTLIDSICRDGYDQTMFNIVNSIILTNCFDLGEVPGYVAGPDWSAVGCGDGTGCKAGATCVDVGGQACTSSAECTSQACSCPDGGSFCPDQDKTCAPLCTGRDQYQKLDVKRNGAAVPHLGLENECQRFTPASLCEAHVDPTACVQAQCKWEEALAACVPDAVGCEGADCLWDPIVDGGIGACLVREEPGWSWVTGSNRICLENGLKKDLDDSFEIFLITGSNNP